MEIKKDNCKHLETMKENNCSKCMEIERDKSKNTEQSVATQSTVSTIELVLTFVERHPKKMGAFVVSLILALLLKLNVEPSNK